jgi:hypothetical protein
VIGRWTNSISENTNTWKAPDRSFSPLSAKARRAKEDQLISQKLAKRAKCFGEHTRPRVYRPAPRPQALRASVAGGSPPSISPSTINQLPWQTSDFNFLTCPFSFLLMKPPFTLGVVGHFGLAVRNSKKSAQWFQRVLGLREEFEFEDGIAVGTKT